MEAPEYFHSDRYSSQFGPAPNGGGEQFVVEDFFDFSNEDDVGDDAAFDAVTAHSTEDTVVTTDTCNSFSGSEQNVCRDAPCARSLVDGTNFSGDLCLPYDDLAHLEWLSNFVEDSFSSEDQQKLQLISGLKTRPDKQLDPTQFRPHPYPGSPTVQNNFIDPTAPHPNPIFDANVAVPAKARSKRPRAAPCNWASRLLAVTPIPTELSSSSSSSTGSPAAVDAGLVAGVPPPAMTTGGKRPGGSKKKDSGAGDHQGGGGGEGRRCLHCATDKTPQWRTGPMGPKTLCNACGVRYKSGRLVPEYRPAASPTFVLTKHSNSHRKVLELRRQKEMMRAQQQFLAHHHQGVVFDVSGADDFLIHQNIGPDFSQLI